LWLSVVEVVPVFEAMELEQRVEVLAIGVEVELLVAQPVTLVYQQQQGPYY
jgi:hypothetical protein